MYVSNLKLREEGIIYMFGFPSVDNAEILESELVFVALKPYTAFMYVKINVVADHILERQKGRDVLRKQQ